MKHGARICLHGLVARAVELLRRCWPLRLLSFATLAALVFVAVAYEVTPASSIPAAWRGTDIGNEQSGAPFSAFPGMLCDGLVHALHLFAFLCWLPLDATPLLTAAGGRTLTAYLLRYEANYLSAAVAQPLLTAGYGGGVAAAYCLMPALSTALFCSAAVAFAMWPLVSPSWAGALCFGLEMSPPPEGRRCDWRVWVCSFVAFSFACNLANAYSDRALLLAVSLQM